MGKIVSRIAEWISQLSKLYTWIIGQKPFSISIISGLLSLVFGLLAYMHFDGEWRTIILLSLPLFTTIASILITVIIHNILFSRRIISRLACMIVVVVILIVSVIILVDLSLICRIVVHLALVGSIILFIMLLKSDSLKQFEKLSPQERLKLIGISDESK